MYSALPETLQGARGQTSLKCKLVIIPTTIYCEIMEKQTQSSFISNHSNKTNFLSLSHTHTLTVSLIPLRNKIGNNTIYLFISIQVINKFTHKHTQKQFITNVKVISFNTLFNVKLHSLLPFHWSDAMVNKLLLIVFYIRSKHIRIYESERSNSCPLCSL